MFERFDTFLFEYRHEGEDWLLHVHARDETDAIERIRSLAWARLKGRSLGSAPAAIGVFGSFAVWFRNIAHRLRS